MYEHTFMKAINQKLFWILFLGPKVIKSSKWGVTPFNSSTKKGFLSTATTPCILTLPPPNCLFCFLVVDGWLRPLRPTTRRTRKSPLLQCQRSPLRGGRCWDVRRALTPPLPPLQRRSTGQRPASACWPPRGPPRFGRTQPQRVPTVSRSTSPRPKHVSEREIGGTASEMEGWGLLAKHTQGRLVLVAANLD